MHSYTSRLYNGCRVLGLFAALGAAHLTGENGERSEPRRAELKRPDDLRRADSRKAAGRSCHLVAVLSRVYA